MTNISGPGASLVGQQIRGPNLPFGLEGRQLGLVLGLGGMLLVSTDSLLARAADVNGWVVAFWFGVFSCPTMLLYLLLLERGNPIEAVRRSGWWVLVSAGLQTTSTISFIMAVKLTAISNVVVIVASVPLITALLAWLLLKERPTLRVWVAIAVSLVGILIVVSGTLGVGGLQGNLLALSAVVAFSFNLIIWRRFPALSRILVLVIAGFLTALLAWTQTDVGGQTGETYLLLALMGTVLGPTGRVAIASATRYITAAEVGLVTPVETVAASLWAWLAFSEVPSAATIIGGSIILAAVAYGTILPALARRSTANT